MMVRVRAVPKTSSSKQREPTSSTKRGAGKVKAGGRGIRLAPTKSTSVPGGGVWAGGPRRRGKREKGRRCQAAHRVGYGSRLLLEPLPLLRALRRPVGGRAVRRPLLLGRGRGLQGARHPGYEVGGRQRRSAAACGAACGVSRRRLREQPPPQQDPRLWRLAPRQAWGAVTQHDWLRPSAGDSGEAGMNMKGDS